MSAIILRQATQRVVRVGPFLDATDGVTPETGITLGAADQAEALKAAGVATVDISGATFAAVTGCDGYYDLTLTTSHTDTVGDLTIVIQDASVCFPVRMQFLVIEEAVFDRDYAAAATGEVVIVDGSLDAAKFAAGVLFDNGVDTVIVGTNNDKTGYSLTQAFPTNFASLGINGSGHISRVTLADTITTYTGNTPQTADHTAAIAALPTAAQNADAVLDELVSGHNIPGSLSDVVQQNGLMIGDVQTWWDPNGGVLSNIIDAILIDTNELQIDWANGGRLDLILDDIPQQVFDGQPDGPVVFGSLFQLVNDAHDHAEQLLVDVADLPTNAELTAALVGVGGTPISPTYPDEGNTWRFDSDDQQTASNVIDEVVGFDGLLSMRFTGTISGAVVIHTAELISVTPESGTATGLTTGTIAVSADKQEVHIPTVITAAGTNTFLVKVTTTDSQIIYRRGVLEAEAQ